MLWRWHGRKKTPDGTLILQMYTLLVGLSCGLGVVILAGGDERFSSVSFDGPKNLVQWVPVLHASTCWGLLFLAYGLLLIATLGHSVAVHALRFGLVVYMFLAISFFASILVQPTAAMTGIVVYVVLGLAHAVLGEHVHRLGWR